MLTSFWLVLLGGPTALKAAEPVHATRESRVEGAADRVQVDGELGRLELEGQVTVQAQRYRLKSQRLQLQRGPRGVEVTGSASVALCTCDDPPVQLRVSRATLAPPTDALFLNLRLELWHVPVLWLPALWLRAPSRWGLTFPRLAYRGEDGFLAVQGAYFPLAVEEGRVTRSLTVGAGAYLFDGARVEAELDTEASTSRVAWDHVRQSALSIDAHGSAALSEATFAYRVDALRGARARVESSSLEVAARRSDRARVSVARVSDVALGFTLRADAARAGAFRDFGAVGPEFYLGSAGGLGQHVSYDAFGVLRTSTVRGNHSQTELFERSRLDAHLRLGPFGIGLVAAQSGALNVAEYQSQGVLRGGLQTRIGLPLRRDWGRLRHFVEPPAGESEPRGDR